jgi:hypothetical protein
MAEDPLERVAMAVGEVSCHEAPSSGSSYKITRMGAGAGRDGALELWRTLGDIPAIRINDAWSDRA